MNQRAMFPDGADLPLFSATEPRATIAPFVVDVSVELEQVGFPVGCRLCRDTGIVGHGARSVPTRCLCLAGQAVRLAR